MKINDKMNELAALTSCGDQQSGMLAVAKSFYDDVKDIDSFEKAGYSWSGYTCSSAGYEYTILEGNKGEEDLQVSIITKAGDNTMSIDDEDVQSILDSIGTTPPAK